MTSARPPYDGEKTPWTRVVGDPRLDRRLDEDDSGKYANTLSCDLVGYVSLEKRTSTTGLPNVHSMIRDVSLGNILDRRGVF